MGHLLSDSVMAASFKRMYAPTLHLPGWLQPEPLWPRQATAEPRLHRRHSDTQRQVWLSLLWRSPLLPQGLGARKLSLVPSKHLWQV